MLTYNIRNLPLLLCLFLPLTYIVGILITEIFVLILTLYFLFFNKDLKYFKYKQIISLLIFSFYTAFKLNQNYNDVTTEYINIQLDFNIDCDEYVLMKIKLEK